MPRDSNNDLIKIRRAKQTSPSNADKKQMELLYAEDEDELRGWRRIFRLPFEPVWYYPLILLGCLQVYKCIYDYAFNPDGKEPELSAWITYYLVDFIYFVDTVLVMCCRNLHGLKISPIELRRPNFIILMDFLSILPVEVMSIKEVYRVLKLNDVLKVFRVLHFLSYYAEQVGDSMVFLYVASYVFQMILASVIMLAITKHSLCGTYNNCNRELDFGEKLTFLYLGSSRVTKRGYTVTPSENLLWLFWCSIAGLVVLFKIYGITYGYITTSLISLFQHKYIFLNKQRSLQDEIKKLNVPEHTSVNCVEFYYIYWRKRRGYRDNMDVMSILPAVMRHEVNIDTCWITFKHSKLFKNMDLPFLRHLSQFIEQTFMLPGQNMFEAKQNKNKMVYLVSGVIQILSEEDGETPILSFSGGTCLGELSLLITHESCATVRCKTFCVVHVLHKADFLRFIKLYKENFVHIRQCIMNRLEMAMKIHELATYTNRFDYKTGRKADQVTIMWLKSVLHSLMEKEGDKSSKHEYNNIFLRDEFSAKRFDKMYFTPANLDMLVISERIELVSDSVFLRSTFPCIVQPGCVILKFWEWWIIMLSLVTGLWIPYYALIEPETPEWYYFFIYFISIVWWVDIAIKLSTGIKTKEATIINVREIFAYRIKHFDFSVDLAAALPLEMCSSVILVSLSSQSWACLHLNKILKLWRIEVMLHHMELRVNTNIVFIRYVNYISFLVYFAYIGSCFLYANNCFNFVCELKTPFENQTLDLFWFIFSICQLMTGVTFISGTSTNIVFHIILLSTSYISCLLFVLVESSISAAHMLHNFNIIKLQELVFDVTKIIKVNKLEKTYNTRILNYVKTQWETTGASNIMYANSVLNDIPAHIYKPLTEAAYASIIGKIPFFQDLSEEILSDLCIHVRSSVLPPNEVICYTGGICEGLHLIEKGFCQLYSGTTGLKEQLLKAGDSFAVIEACTGLTFVNTVITVTHCKIIHLNIRDVFRVFSEYESHMAHIQEEIASLNIVNQLQQLPTKESFDLRYGLDSDADIESSFCTFNYHLEIDSFEEYEYYVPFDDLGFCCFVRLFLMRFTILPNGTFIHCWEIFRCIFALTSVVIFSLNTCSTCYNCGWYYIRIALDVPAWIDLYVRFHVAYYNRNGLLITHPLKTAGHYLRHSFLIDFIAIFPFHLFIINHNAASNRVLNLLQLNRLLQIHRFIGYINYFESSSIAPNSTAIVLKYTGIFLVISHLIGTVLINFVCYFDENIIYPNPTTFSNGIVCRKKSWITTSDFMKPLTPERAQLYAVYLSASVLTVSGMQGFGPLAFSLSGFITVYAIFQFIITTHLTALLITFRSTRDSSLLTYQHALRSLIEYMRTNKIKSYIRKQLIAHFELKWKRKRGKDIHLAVKYFTPALRNDILYDIYGKVMQANSVFPPNCGSFWRNLLQYMTHDVILNDCYVISVNDVSEHVYMLYRGKVNATLTGSNEMVILTSGSIFGNLSNTPTSRQRINVVANGHIELLMVKSTDFNKVLDSYPDVKSLYYRLRALNSDYLSGKTGLKTEDSMNDRVNYKKMRNPFWFVRKYVFDYHSRFVTAWKLSILIVVCYLAVALSMYEIAVSDYNIYNIVFLYLCDLLYLFDIYVKFHTPYEQGDGTIIRDLTLIQKHRCRDRLDMSVCIVSAIYLDVCVWFLPLPTTFVRHLVSVFRINRLLRVVYLFQYFKEHSKRIHVNLFRIHMMYLLMSICLLIHAIVCVMIVLGCTHLPNMHPTMLCDHDQMSTYQKFEEYGHYIFVVISCLIHVSQTLAYPESALFIIYFIILMIGVQIIYAICIAWIYSVLHIGTLQQNRFTRLMCHIDYYLAREYASEAVTRRVWNYLQLLWKMYHGPAFPLLLAEAPYHLREIILNDAFSYHIINHFIFEKCHNDFIRQVVASLRNNTYFRGDYIAVKGSIDNCMHIIHSGQVVVLSEDGLHNEEKLVTLESGDSFAILQGIYQDTPHYYSYRSIHTCVILTLDRDMWWHLLDFFPSAKNLIYQRAAKYKTVVT